VRCGLLEAVEPMERGAEVEPAAAVIRDELGDSLPRR
jgi:hypothetical protein